MGEERIRDVIVSAVHAFPCISPAAAEVLQLLGDPDINVAEVEAAVRKDPGLTADVLKLANSAYFGFSGKIGSVGRAVSYLGWKRMYQLVIAASVNSMLEGAVKGYGLPPGEMWRHALACSVAAEVIAAEHGIRAPEETFTAALLHDVGKLVMGKFVEPYVDLIEMTASKGVPFDEAEREILGTDHAEVGAWILEHWSLPKELVAAVRWHHDPDAGGETALMTDIVHVADLVSVLMGIGVGTDGIRYRHSLPATARLGLKGDRLKQVTAKTLEGLEAISAALAPQAATA